MTDYSDQGFPGDVGDKCWEYKINTFVTRSSHSNIRALCLLLKPPLASFASVHEPMTPTARIIFQNDWGACPTFVPRKSGKGSRHWLKLASTTAYWPTPVWYRVSGCQVIEDCQSNFRWPLAPFLQLFYFCLLLSDLPSPSLCLFPPAVFISNTQIVKLMGRRVKCLAGNRKHPCDNCVCL